MPIITCIYILYTTISHLSPLNHILIKYPVNVTIPKKLARVPMSEPIQQVVFSFMAYKHVYMYIYMAHINI